MYSQYSTSGRMDKAMNPDQFDQVVEAILAGKYSWACVLILRFGGYNPLHYIPYRTYNRLLKDNLKNIQANQETAPKSNSRNPGSASSKIRDLSYLEPANKQRDSVRGGAGKYSPEWHDLQGDSLNNSPIFPTVKSGYL